MAAKVVANPVAVLGLQSKQFTKGLASAGGSVKGFASGFASSITGVLGTVAKFTGIGALIGGALGGIGMGALVKSQMEAIDVTAKLSDRLGISTEQLTGMQHAADLAGISGEKLAGGMSKMLKTLGDAAAGGKVASAAFSSLGLDAKELANLPTDQAMGAIADKLKAIENPAERAAAAVKIFGKSGQDLLPLMMEGSAGIAAAVKEADALGISFSRVDAAKVEEANDAITRIKAAFKGVATQIAIAIAPGVKFVADMFTQIGIRVVAVVKQYLPPIIGFIGQMIAQFKAFAAPIIAWIQSVLPAVMGFVIDSVVTMYGYVTNVLSGLLDFAGTIFGGLWGVVTWAFGGITGESFNIVKVFTWLKDNITAAVQVIGYSIKNWRLVFEIAGLSIAYNVVKIGNQIAYTFTEVIPSLLSWFADNWKEIFITIFDGTVAIFTNMGKNIGNFASALWSFLKGDGFNFEWTGLLEGFESTLKEMPKIAEREVGALEGALGAELAAAQSKLTEGLVQDVTSQTQLAEDLKRSLLTGTNKAVAELPKAPEFKSPEVGAFGGDSVAAAKVEKVKLAEGTNITTGSAESLALRDAIIPPAGAATTGAPEVEIPKAIRETADEYQPTLIEAVKQLAEKLLPLVEKIARKEGMEVGAV